MDKQRLDRAAAAFTEAREFTLEPLATGLIHQTFKLTPLAAGIPLVLQAINKTVFVSPGDVVHNYRVIYDYLEQDGVVPQIPAPIPARNGELLWTDPDGQPWRATAFIAGSYSPAVVEDAESAWAVAHCFGSFTASLGGLAMSRLRVIIPGFHDLSLRYRQFEAAIVDAPMERLLKSTHLIAELRQRRQLADRCAGYASDSAFPQRVMHHDCKISNILFDRQSHTVICPVDLDTVMPGRFYSDLGDMIRTMACRVDETSTDWEAIGIRPEFYQAILKGWLDAMGGLLTDREKMELPEAGKIMTYMQALRFLADYLQGDKYYRTEHPDQNLHRALNQQILLEKLEKSMVLK